MRVRAFVRVCVCVCACVSVCVPAAESSGAALQGAAGPQRRILEEAGAAAAVRLVHFLSSG